MEVINSYIMENDPELQKTIIGCKFIPVLTRELLEDINLSHTQGGMKSFLIATKEKISEETREFLKGSSIIVFNGLGDYYETMYDELEKLGLDKTNPYDLSDKIDGITKKKEGR